MREHEPISHADLARRMDIARGMVTALVDELVAPPRFAARHCLDMSEP